MQQRNALRQYDLLIGEGWMDGVQSGSKCRFANTISVFDKHVISVPGEIRETSCYRERRLCYVRFEKHRSKNTQKYYLQDAYGKTIDLYIICFVLHVCLKTNVFCFVQDIYFLLF